MKQITVISGKGGTGKTSLVAAFAGLTHRAVLADCDVDAADLHLVLQPVAERRDVEEFRAGYEVVFDPEWCSGCGECVELCRFEAIRMVTNRLRAFPVIDPFSCEGCGCCANACLVEALALREKVAGEIFVSTTRFGPMVHARLGIAQASSGKLVTVVRNYAQEIAEQENRDLVLVDGSPGIGCPVIASLAGVDAAVVVTEPTVAGRHDLERVLTLCEHFKVRSAVVVNKFDLNAEVTQEIEQRARERSAAVLGRIPFDPIFVQAMVAGKTVLEEGGRTGVTKRARNLGTGRGALTSKD